MVGRGYFEFEFFASIEFDGFLRRMVQLSKVCIFESFLTGSRAYREGR
jgi:hypothetical protein